MLKKTYTSPEIDAVVIAESDILSGSDVIIDGSDLFDETQN